MKTIKLLLISAIIETMYWWAPKNKSGFTIVEIIIVIVIIGILAAIILVTYTGAQSRATDATARTDLTNAAKVMDIAKSFDGTYPTTLPSTIKPSDKVALALVSSSLPYYNNITPVQNGVLLSQICQDLVAAGKGKGTNAGGATDTYIIGCGNWNDDSMQITGWATKVFPTPINADTFTGYAASVPAGGAWHPNQQAVVRDFYAELHTRFQAQGGSYPIVSFWDAWATPTNGGVQYQALPTPNPNGNTNTYCIQATSGSKSWNIRAAGVATSGPC